MGLEGLGLALAARGEQDRLPSGCAFLPRTPMQSQAPAGIQAGFFRKISVES